MLLIGVFILLTAVWFGLGVLFRSHVQSPTRLDPALFFLAGFGSPLVAGLLVRDILAILALLLAYLAAAMLNAAVLVDNGLRDLTYDVGLWGFLVYRLLIVWAWIAAAYAVGCGLAVLGRRLVRARA